MNQRHLRVSAILNKRHLLLRFAASILIFVLVLPGAAAKTSASLPPVVITTLAPTPRHETLDRTIASLLHHYHYRQSRLNDAMSSDILNSYLEALDFNRSFFLARDINKFVDKYRFKLDDYLKAGDLTPAYEIFNFYQQRMAERVARIGVQLHRPINFNVDESVDLDRKDAPWAKSRIALDEIWRKQLKNELLTLMLAGKALPEAIDTLEHRYEARLRRVAQSNSEDVFQTYMNAVSRSFDPHTAYFSPRASENFDIQMRLSLEGIGTVLRMEDEQITVVELVPGGPADLSQQLKPNDRIVGVGQGDNGQLRDVIGWRLDDVVDLIRGPKGTVVRLQILAADAGADAAAKTIRLVRDTVKLEKQAAQSTIKTLPLGDRMIRIGMITIPTFYSDFAAAQRGEKNYRSTSRDVRRILADLQREGVDGIAIDLRQNGGGSLQEAVELTGLFIEKGPIVQVRDTSGDIEVENDPDPSLVYDGPMAVLVDSFSASASEIFAGAIQDYGRGLVIGDPTFGKGTVQTLVDLNRFLPQSEQLLGQLKLTIAKFYRVSGSSTQHRGVTPDISFPSVFSSDEVGESAQEHALPWDRIRPVSHQSNQRIASLVPELRRRHQTRMNDNPAFKLLLEEIQEAKQARQQTTISLLESKRRAERVKAEQRQRIWENQFRRAQGLEPFKEGEEVSESQKNEQPDLLLDESARVVADLISLIDTTHKGNSKALVMTTGK